MLTIENVETYGWEAAIRGMRNPKNSWDKSDSHKCWFDINEECEMANKGHEQAKDCPDDTTDYFCIGIKDLTLMKALAHNGTDHGKFLRMITVTLDIVAPLYWWKEFDTYKVGTVANSCSTMHKIHAKEFTVNDFSHEHIIEKLTRDEYISAYALVSHDEYSMAYAMLLRTVDTLNYFRTRYIETGDKTYWWGMIQLLPSSYNQRRTVMMNYAVLKNIYHARKDHKLDEWHTFCGWIESLPYSELITGRH